MSEIPIYTSGSIARSLWQEYRIYHDRIEFDTQFGLMTVSFDHIEQVSVLGSDAKGLLQGELRLKNFRPALKLDWANFLEHVVLDKNAGYIHRLLFTPENPESFKNALNKALSLYRDKQND